MTISDKIEFLWNKAFEDALGAGHADPSTYADDKVASLHAHLRRVERAQMYPNGHLRTGCRISRGRG